jgi:hypothetical protein
MIPTIQLDDSGWGSLLGGVLIGGYNTGTKKFFHTLLEPVYFQAPYFKRQDYKERAVWLMLENIHKIGPASKIEICRGYALDGIYHFYKDMVSKVLKDTPHEIVRVEIGDPLQSYLEEKFAQHLHKFGVPQATGGAHCLSFDNQLQWIKDNPKKLKYVKTGWNSWNNKYRKELGFK